MICEAVVALALVVGAAPTREQATYQRALTLFERGRRHYNEGRFADAVRLLREAHALVPDPVLLYNLARALESQGDFEGAVEAYTRYVRENPDVPDRGAIEQRTATLKKTVEERAALERAKEELARKERAQVTVPPPTVTVEPSRGPLPWVVAGTGVACLGTGIAFGILASQRLEQAGAEPVQQTAWERHGQAKRFAATANVLYGAGALLAAGGAAWLVFGGEDSPVAGPTVRVSVGPGALVLSGSLP